MHQHDYYDEQLHLYFQIEHNRCLFLAHLNQRANPMPETDIRLKGKHTVINIRYGTTIEKEKKRLFKHAKERAVTHAWAREKWILQNLYFQIEHNRCLFLAHLNQFVPVHDQF
jgi:hypothetical protein